MLILRHKGMVLQKLYKDLEGSVIGGKTEGGDEDE